VGKRYSLWLFHHCETVAESGLEEQPVRKDGMQVERQEWTREQRKEKKNLENMKENKRERGSLLN
jgi:hypothetical protein